MGMIDHLWKAQQNKDYIERLNAAVYLENLWQKRKSIAIIAKLFGESVPTLLSFVDEKWPEKVLGKCPNNDEDIWKLIDKFPVPKCK